jgi:hypothetical protein
MTGWRKYDPPFSDLLIHPGVGAASSRDKRGVEDEGNKIYAPAAIRPAGAFAFICHSVGIIYPA